MGRAAASPPPRPPLSTGILVGGEVGTGEATRIELRMVDEWVVRLGDNTRFEVRDGLVSARLATGNVALGLLESVFSLVTGRLGGAGVYLEKRAGRVEITRIGAATSVTAPDRAPAPPPAP